MIEVGQGAEKAATSLKRHWLFLALLFVCVVVVLLPASPAFHNVPKRDPGVFLYMGQQILEGQIPYRDMWDHKGPTIFYINALGLALGGGSQWGIWALELASLSTAVVLSFWLMRRLYGAGAAGAATLLWLIALGPIIVLERGNYTEEFALLLHFMAYALFWLASTREKSRRPRAAIVPMLAIGVTLTLTFFLRANNISAQLAIITYLLLTILVTARRREALKQLVALFLSAGVTFLLIVAYFAANGALWPFVDAAFIFNFSYAETQWPLRLEAIQAGMSRFLPFSLTLTAVAGWLVSCRLLWHKRPLARPLAAFMVVLIVALPLEIYLSTLSGQSFEHYFILWLPTFSLLTGYFFNRVLAWRSAESGWSWLRTGRWQVTPRMLSAVVVAIVALAVVDSARKLESAFNQLGRSGIFEQGAAVDYVREQIPAGRPLIFWGAEATLHFLSERPSATRFVYQYPLYLANSYDKGPMIAELFDDLERARPWIVDTSPGNQKVPPLDPEARQAWLADEKLWAKHRMQKVAVPDEMAQLYDYVQTNYEIAGVIEPLGWRVYRPRP